MIKTFIEQEPEEQLITALSGTGYALFVAKKDSEKYLDYSLGKFEKLNDEDIINMRILDILFELGFSGEELGTFLYKDLIYEVCKKLSKDDKENLILMCNLKNAFSN